jgi:hypothetical protein
MHLQIIAAISTLEGHQQPDLLRAESVQVCLEVMHSSMMSCSPQAKAPCS